MKEVTLRGVKVVTVMKIAAIFYATLGFVIGAVGTVTSIIRGPGPGQLRAFQPFAILIMPVFYGILGALGGIITGALYNLFAGWIGGIRMVISSSEEEGVQK